MNEIIFFAFKMVNEMADGVLQGYHPALNPFKTITPALTRWGHLFPFWVDDGGLKTRGQKRAQAD
jgi:hypothetical protein